MTRAHIFCDLCGNEIHRNDGVVVYHLHTHKAGMELRALPDKTSDKHLCAQCIRGLKEALQNIEGRIAL